MMYIHSNNEIDKRINVAKIANNISTVGDNSIAAKQTLKNYVGKVEKRLKM